MTGTKSGGIKAREAIISKHGADHYARIGALGGKVGTTGGFASNKLGVDGLTGRERAALAGAKGGKVSKRKRSL